MEENLPVEIIVIMGPWFIGFFALVIFGFVNNLKYIVNLKKLITYLKENHPGLYKELGEPSLFNIKPQNMFSTLKFTRTFLKSSYSVSDNNLQEMKIKVAKLLHRGYFFIGIGFVWFFSCPLFLFIAVKLAE